MNNINKILVNLVKWKYLDVCVLVLINLLLHLSAIMIYPHLFFDEGYYVPDALHIIEHNGAISVGNPPLAKLFIALGISLFGNNPFGWRLFSVVCGVIGIAIFYLICRKLKLSKPISFLATLLLSFENLTFLVSNIAMLDVYSFVFMLTSFYLYLKGRYLSSGIFVALAASAKISGLLALAVISLHWLFTNRKNIGQYISLLFISLLSVLFILAVSDLIIWHTLMNPVAHLTAILKNTIELTFSAKQWYSAIPPWQWITSNVIIIPTLEPIYVFTISVSLWILIIPSFIFNIWKSIKGNEAAKFSVCWFIGTYFSWVLLVL
jgi:predicted membrane-bound dolichyl-phosphate-mannose-protein mannosyltransferase